MSNHGPDRFTRAHRFPAVRRRPRRHARTCPHRRCEHDSCYRRGPGPEKLDAAIPYAEAHDWIYTTVGIHPHEAKEVTPAHLDTLARLAKHPKVIALGEIGLDYFYDHSPRDVQQRVFRDQMQLAHAAKLPIIIHCRDAWSDCLDMLEEHWKPTGLGGILHCFTSTIEDAQRGLDMGFMVSFTGNLTYPKAQNIRDVAKALPLENILIETDSPYLSPQPLRGKRNEPAYVAEVAKALANVRNLGTEETAATTAGNFRRFFNLPNRSRPRLRYPAEQGGGFRRTAIALLTVKEIFELVREDLVLVEQELSRQSASAYQPVSEITSYLARRGREAPAARAAVALSRLCSRAASQPPQRHQTGRRSRIAPQRHADPRRCDR